MPDPRPFVRAPGDAAAVEHAFGGAVSYWARGSETGDALTLLESVVEPGKGPPLHVHPEQDEFVYVLDGLLRFRLDDHDCEAAAGSTVFIPRNVPHTWQSTGETHARFLFGFAPAAPGMEHFFERGAELAPDTRLEQAFAKLAGDAGMEVLGPPLAEAHPA